MSQAKIHNKSTELTIEQSLHRAIGAHQEGKIQEAEVLYRTVLKSHSTHPVANHNLGVIAVSVNKAGLALPFFKTATEANPKVEQFWLSYIDALIKDNQFDMAKQVLSNKKVIALLGKKIDALQVELNTKNKTLQNHNKTEVSHQSNSLINPPQHELDTLLKYYQNGQYLDAEKLALSMTKQFPKHQFPWKVLGAVYQQTNKISDAVYANQRAVELDPNDCESYNNLSVNLNSLDRLEEAEANSKKAILIKSDFAQGYYNLGLVQKKIGKLEEAEINYRQAIKFQPDLAPAYTNLGNILQQLGRLEDAVSSHCKAIEINADYAEAHNNLGNTFQELGKLKEAEASYKQSINLRPNFAETHNNLGIILQQLSRLEEAEISFRKAIEINPKFIEGYKNLAGVLKYFDKLSEAEECYVKVISLDPNYVQAYDELGVVQQASDKIDDAEESYKKIISLDPFIRPITVSKGTRLFRSGDYENALKYYDSYNTRDARARALETLYHLGRIEEIYQRLEINEKLDASNLSAAAFASFIAEEQQKETAHSFCKKPLDFLFFSNLSYHKKDTNTFISNIIEDLKDIPTSWEQPGQSVKMGLQTDGDLFRFPKENLHSLKNIILNEIDSYYEKFKDQKCGFIEKWPLEKNILGWHIILKEQGYNHLHIHPDGWLSGVIYLKVVPSLGKNEGAIQFDIGKKFSNENYSNTTHNPQIGDIVLFPSSLYHGTIPFSSDAERIIISFDLMPKENLKNLQ
ncbi:tetratricopeptide repeat protein [Pseudomonadota bacterium]|nr:tetratricopeptide repeat protein [Pseudomonadota bacterium]